MAREFRPVTRDQGFLLPPDMTRWLPERHLVWFVIDAVAALDLSGLRARYRLGGQGRAAYDPAMLLGVLIYAYAEGVRSSRRIELLCERDVAYRVLCAGDVPDHSTLARFRQSCSAEFAGLFAQVLAVCAGLGLGRLGRVALDGTKIAAAASPAANVDLQRLRQLAARLLGEAERVDAGEDAEHGPRRGDELPEPVADRTGRVELLRAELARQEAERVTRQRAAQQQAARLTARAEAAVARETDRAERQWRRWHDADAASRAAGGGGCPGTRPVRPEQHSLVRRAEQQRQRAEAAGARRVADAANDPPRRVNATDPDSRLMPVRGGGFVQGYNCQLAVTDDSLILAADVTNDCTDYASFAPMMSKIEAAARLMQQAASQPAEPLGTVLADAGYASDANLQLPGPDRLIALGRDPAGRKTAARSPQRDAMRERLKNPDERALYRRRGALVEPVNGRVKEQHRFRRFSRRGLTACRAELQLLALAFNLRAAHTASG